MQDYLMNKLIMDWKSAFRNIVCACLCVCVCVLIPAFKFNFDQIS